MPPRHLALLLPLLGLCLAGPRQAPAHAAAAPPTTTLQAVRAAGKLACGLVIEQEDWTKTDLHEGLGPFEVEICKAVAVAVLGDKAKVDVHPYESGVAAEQGLKKGEVPLVLGMTPTATAMWEAGIAFGPPVFYDGQSFLVRGDVKAEHLADLAGLRVCFIEGTANDAILQARTLARGIKILPLPFQEEGEMEDGLSDRHCDAISAYASRLAVERASYPRQLGHDRIMADWLTLAPVAPAYRRDDAQWAMIVDWTVNALVQAEESGVTRDNVGERLGSEDPVVKRLLGTDWAAARALGLADHFWAEKVISVVGNYGEIYGRTVGASLGLPRGRNALWTQGGLLHALPVQ
jgi:general L-amino acid transport system substrate-binding protein